MPISAAGSEPPTAATGAAMKRLAGRGQAPAWRAADDGFTLVELMVVITIIGLASAVAMWVMPDPRGRVQDEAARFAVRTRAAHDEAIVNARPVSVWVSAGGYGFDQRLAGNWSPISEKPLRVERWKEGTRASVPDLAGRARVTFDATGLSDRPLDGRLQRGGAAATVRIAGDGSVEVDA
jgi:general secretion pathway protein H